MRVKILTAFLFLYSCAGFLANADKDERNYCVAQLNNIIENFDLGAARKDSVSSSMYFRDKTMTNESWKFYNFLITADELFRNDYNRAPSIYTLPLQDKDLITIREYLYPDGFSWGNATRTIDNTGDEEVKAGLYVIFLKKGLMENHDDSLKICKINYDLVFTNSE
jgi:hypothetical protein